MTKYILSYLALTFIVFGRYLLVSGLFYVIFYVGNKDGKKFRRVSSKLRKPGQTRKEIGRSFWSSAIFALAGLAMLIAWEKGMTKLYVDPMKFGVLYLVLSGPIVLIIHEVYYYFLHRLMHLPRIYPYVHKMHHDSIVNSPWTSFSFDPIETVLQAIFIPIVIFLIPLHVGVLLFLLIFMTISATVNHLGIEIYPKGFQNHYIGQWFIGARHHSLHHEEFVTNYGLYFTFLDKIMDTESTQYTKSHENEKI